MTKHHSANVKLALVVDGTEYPLAQVGPGFLVTKKPEPIHAGWGELVNVIDGKQERKRVTFRVSDVACVLYNWSEVKQ